MDTSSAFVNGEIMVFDWNKLVDILKSISNWRGVNVYAGLRSDLEWTGGCILKCGKLPESTYTYLASTWATPIIYFDDGTEIECWSYQSETPDWGPYTYWPQEVREKLGV